MPVTGFMSMVSASVLEYCHLMQQEAVDGEVTTTANNNCFIDGEVAHLQQPREEASVLPGSVYERQPHLVAPQHQLCCQPAGRLQRPRLHPTTQLHDHMMGWCQLAPTKHILFVPLVAAPSCVLAKLCLQSWLRSGGLRSP